MAHTGRTQQCAEERPFEVTAAVLARHAQHQDVGAMASQMQCHVIDGVRLAHTRACVNQGTGDQDTDAVLHQFDQLLDRSRGDTVVPARQQMGVQRQRARLQQCPRGTGSCAAALPDAGGCNRVLNSIGHECPSGVGRASGRRKGPGPTSGRRSAPLNALPSNTGSAGNQPDPAPASRLPSRFRLISSAQSRVEFAVPCP